MGAKIQLKRETNIDGEQLFPVKKVDKKIYGIFLGNVCTDPQKSKQMIENIKDNENDLGWSNLDGPATDIYQMQQFFYKNKIGGIQIHCSEQHIHTKVDILEQIGGIFNQENDATIFYFSGHGSIQGLIIESRQKGIEYITFDDLYMLWKTRVSQQKLCFILLDCCHAGIWVQALKQISDFSVAILASCSDIQTSKDLGQSRGGLFTWNINKTLENCQKNIDFLIDESIHDQTPEFWGIHYKVYNIFGFPLFLTSKDEMRDYLAQKLIKKLQVQQNGTKYEGQWLNDIKNGFGIMTYSDGRKYEGQFKDDLKHGKGMFTFNNGERYEGEYQMGKRNGKGIIIYNNGSRYEGEYVDDMKHGKGFYTSPDGQRYIGLWVQNKLNGEGIKTEPNGFNYQGQFKNNKMHGKGILSYPDGRKYEGQFSDNKKNGQGVLSYPYGRKQQGVWSYDLFQQ